MRTTAGRVLHLRIYRQFCLKMWRVFQRSPIQPRGADARKRRLHRIHIYPPLRRSDTADTCCVGPCSLLAVQIHLIASDVDLIFHPRLAVTIPYLFHHLFAEGGECSLRRSPVNRRSEYYKPREIKGSRHQSTSPAPTLMTILRDTTTLLTLQLFMSWDGYQFRKWSSVTSCNKP